MKARILGTGVYLPKRVLTNKDFERMVETSDDWIVSRTGIKERRIAEDEETTSVLGFKAARKALENANVSPDDIDYIIVATSIPDYLFPSTACLIQKELGIKGSACLDILAACSGFIYGLSLAASLIKSQSYKNILLIASEKLSSITDYEDRATCVLFGDGACAAVISNEGPGLAIETTCLGADGEQSDLVMLPGGGSKHPQSKAVLDNKQNYIKMNGREVFKHAVRRMEAAANKCLELSGYSESDIGWMVPHQANERIIDAIAKRFNVPTASVYKTVAKYGNTSASSVGIALHELLEEKKDENPDHILLVAFGSGLTWGAAFLKRIGQ